MFKITILPALFLVFAVNAVLGDDIFTDENKKDIKMVTCSGCKDQAIQEKLQGFFGCIKENFPDDYAKGEKNHKENEHDPEACWTEMSKHLEEFRAKSEDNFKKLIECFESHIPDRKLLETCHS